MTTSTTDVSTCGKYRNGANQVAFTEIGDVRISTVWWKRTDPGGDWFETLMLGEELPVGHGSEAEALKFHAEAVAKLVGELTR